MLRVGNGLIESELVVPAPLDEVFRFFADASNLADITPGWLSLAILTDTPIEMRVGAHIDYRIRMRGLPMRWTSRISAWEPGSRFVDEQVRGPYRSWRHEHTFEQTPDGTMCTDRVEYDYFGRKLIDPLLVRRDLRAIFEHRRAKMVERF